jgi:hypothetical protein
VTARWCCTSDSLVVLCRWRQSGTWSCIGNSTVALRWWRQPGRAALMTAWRSCAGVTAQWSRTNDHMVEHGGAALATA